MPANLNLLLLQFLVLNLRFGLTVKDVRLHLSSDVVRLSKRRILYWI